MAPNMILAPTRVIPDVWSEPATGLEWCDCGDHHPLTRDTVEEATLFVTGEYLPDTITHRQVILIAMDVWNYVSVCRFFTLAMEDAAVRVWGEVAAEYPLDAGLVIVKTFSDRWNGCPTIGCDGDWTAEDIEDGDHEH
ncbi:MAG: hypothetical protein FWG47_01435 [Propionibacteriaceae bacterium]|nr:hypothetical protein [Propionibacteriaceae bacterium]